MAFPTSPSNGDRYTTDLGITYEYDSSEDKWFVVSEVVNLQNYIHLQDQKANGVFGGTFTQDVWQTRDLNVKLADQPDVCTLSSNQFTLLAGTYIIYATAPAFQVERHKAKLRNISDSSDEIIGTSEYNYATTVSNISIVSGVFTITATKTFEIQHRCFTTRVDEGFGNRCDFGVIEVYTDVQLWKIDAVPTEGSTGVNNYIHLQDLKTAGTDGGDFTQDAWRTRDLTTKEVDQPNACTLSSNQFTLLAGTYIINAYATCYRVRRNKTRLQNISDATTTLLGATNFAVDTQFGYSDNLLIGMFTITSTKTFELQHYCQITRNGNGFGLNCNIGGIDEIYADIQLWKVN